MRDLGGMDLKFPFAAGGGGGNSFTLINHIGTFGAGDLTTSAIDTSGANLLILAFSRYVGSGVETVSDSKGNTWVPLTLKSDPGGEAYVRLYYAASPTVGAGHTFTVAGSQFDSVAVQAWSGANAAPLDVQNGAVNTGAATSIAPGSITPTNNNSLIITAGNSTTGSSGTYAIDSGFTITENQMQGSGHEGLGLAYLKQNTLAAVNPTWSWTGATDCAAVIAVFKP